MSPPFYKRTMNFASELKLGALQAFTIYTETGLLSFFMHDDICMSVRHAGRGFLPGVREKAGNRHARARPDVLRAAPPASPTKVSAAFVRRHYVHHQLRQQGDPV